MDDFQIQTGITACTPRLSDIIGDPKEASIAISNYALKLADSASHMSISEFKGMKLVTGHTTFRILNVFIVSKKVCLEFGHLCQSR
jgi:hypothetical protein